MERKQVKKCMYFSYSFIFPSPHVHLHVIPRFANDGFSLKLPKNEPKNPDRSALQKIADAIRIEL